MMVPLSVSDHLDTKSMKDVFLIGDMRTVLVLRLLYSITCHTLQSIHDDKFDRVKDSIDNLISRRMIQAEEGLDKV